MPDPLDDIYDLSDSARILVLITAVRAGNEKLANMEKKLDRAFTAIWTLIGTIIAGVAVYYITTPHNNPAKAAYALISNITNFFTN